MPKVIDHDAVRAELADAAVRLLEREGLPAISVRRVAEEAGVTPGYLRHYYPTQVALERALTVRLAADTQARILSILDSGEPGGRAGARAALSELLPIDARRRLEVAVAYRFVISAADLPEYADDLGLLVAGLLSVARFAVAEITRFEHAWNLMEPFDDPILEQRAQLLAQIVDGISLHGMQQPSAGADALLGRLDVALDAIAALPPVEL